MLYGHKMCLKVSIYYNIFNNTFSKHIKIIDFYLNHKRFSYAHFVQFSIIIAIFAPWLTFEPPKPAVAFQTYYFSMEPIKNFSQLTEHLKSLTEKKRVAVICPDDEATQYAVERALKEGFASFVLIGDGAVCRDFAARAEGGDLVEVVEVETPVEAAKKAVEFAREGKVDVIMKGIVNTDDLLRAILNKETGILPQGQLLTHLTAAHVPDYHKLLFFSDVAVIPYPTLQQRVDIIKLDLDVIRRFGIEQPKVALIHFTEKVNPKFPNSVDYQTIVGMADNGEFGNALVAGPMDAKTACDRHSAEVKHIASPVCGDADLVHFPNIESGNTFYKALSLFGHADMAGTLLGPKVPVMLPSRSDSGASKYYSLCLTLLAG